MPVPRERRQAVAAHVPAGRVQRRLLPRQHDVPDDQLEQEDVHAGLRDVVRGAAPGLLPVRPGLRQGLQERRRVLPRQHHVRNRQLVAQDVHARVRHVVRGVVSVRARGRASTSVRARPLAMRILYH